MRRLRLLSIAAGYALSFVVVCLGACFADGPGAGHACCEETACWRAPSVDCCSVVPGVSQVPAPLVQAPPAVLSPRAPLDAAPARLPARGLLAASTPSPPLILRI